ARPPHSTADTPRSRSASLSIRVVSPCARASTGTGAGGQHVSSAGSSRGRWHHSSAPGHTRGQLSLRTARTSDILDLPPPCSLPLCPISLPFSARPGRTLRLLSARPAPVRGPRLRGGQTPPPALG